MTGVAMLGSLPQDSHLTGKIFTQRIERNNLTLRTYIKRLARKTICFSRSTELHEKVIETCIEKYMFYSLEVSPKNQTNWIFLVEYGFRNNKTRTLAGSLTLKGNIHFNVNAR